MYRAGFTSIDLSSCFFLARGMRGSEMPHLVTWVVTQCGTPETACRKQCMGLFLQLAPLQQGTEVILQCVCCVYIRKYMYVLYVHVYLWSCTMFFKDTAV